MEKQKKSSPVAIGVIVVVIAAVIVGYLMMKKGNGPLSQIKIPGISNLVLNSNCKLNDPEFCRYVNRTMTGDFYKSGFSGKTITTDKTGKKHESLFEMAGEGKSHFLSYEDGKETANMISIDGATYTKDYTDNKWWMIKKTETKSTEKTNTVEDLKKQFSTEIKDVEDKTIYKKIGKEACGQYMCFKYEVLIADMAGVKEYLYFDDREYLMRKMRVENEDGSISETSFDYKAVTISVPSPVKEMPSYNNLINNEDLQKSIQEQLNKISPAEETTDGSE